MIVRRTPRLRSEDGDGIEAAMFAVIGSWQEPMTLSPGELERLVVAMRRHPGFVHGYWGVDAADTGIAHVVVVLDSRARASAFAAGVATSLGHAQVRVVQVLAESGPAKAEPASAEPAGTEPGPAPQRSSNIS
jgi:hypothetical protein